MKCEHCEDAEAVQRRFGQQLCTQCLADLTAYESERKLEEAAKLQQLVEGTPVAPSIAADLYVNAVKLGSHLIFKTNEDKVEDFFNTNVAPIIHLMKDGEVEAFFTLVERQYFYLKTALSIRKLDRTQEAEALKHTAKVERTREKATKEIAKQKKHASHDKTLSKEDRMKAKLIEGLIGMGLSESDAVAQYDRTMKLKKG